MKIFSVYSIPEIVVANNMPYTLISVNDFFKKNVTLFS